MLEIIPSILTSDPKELKDLLARCEGVAQRVQIDVIDGEFADNKTADISVLDNYEGSLKFDFHLMVKDPINWIEKCVRAQADRIIGQVEMMPDQLEFVGKVQLVGAQVGLALDLPTPVSSLDATILTNLDVVLVMSVKAGFGGQKFSNEVIEKIKRLSDIRENDNSPFRIQIDGGVDEFSIHTIHSDGADEASIGRKLFEGDLSGNIKKFQQAAHGINKYQ